MSLTFTILTVIIIIGFIIWRSRKMKESNRISRISEAKKHGEDIRGEEKIRLRTEERASKYQEERKLRAAQDVNEAKAREERDSRERELRQKIEDRKKNEAEAERRKAEDGKIT